MLSRPFGPRDIVDLARNPARDLGARPKGGFSFPQRGWVYSAAVAFYRGGLSEPDLWAELDRAATGRAMTPWKQAKRDDLKPMLRRFIALERRSEATFIESAFAAPAAVIAWREHRLGLPLGLIVEEGRERGLRQLWIESMFQPQKLGSVLVASATLAAAEVTRGAFEWVETWHLRTGEAFRYLGKDLRANWPRLDRVLGQGEERATDPS